MTGHDSRGKANRALLVGVSEYDNTAPPDGVPGDLPAVKHNLNRLAEALRYGNVFGEREITVCRSPDQVTFDRELWTAAKEAQGVLLLYFAGHGAIPNAGDELFLQLRNAQVVAGGHAVFPGAQLFSTVQAVLASSPARRIVIVLDCCFAGNAAWIRPAPQDKRRVLLLMSVQANHRIDAGGPDTPTPFTNELVALLKEGGDVWFRALADRLRRRMAAAGHRTVRGDAWEPESRVEPGEDVLLAARTKAALDDPPGPGPASVPGPGPAPAPGPDPDPRPAPGPVPGPDPDPRPAPGPVPDPDPDPRPAPGPVPDPDPDPRPAPGPVPDPDPDPRPAPGPVPGPDPDPRPAPGPAPGPDPDPTPGPGPHPAPDPAPDPGYVRRALARLAALIGAVGGAGRALVRGILRIADSLVPGPQQGGWAPRLIAGAAALLVLVAGGFGVHRFAGRGDGPSSCAPPLELRVLTDPDLEPTVRAAADAYLTSAENTTGEGCRLSGITVYSAGAADAVTALRKQTRAWQEPADDDTNPQRDVGPQPDVWIPGSPADAARVTAGQDTDAVAELDADEEPFAYSPIVLAVPQELAADARDERAGPPLTRMIDALRARHPAAAVRRPDPEHTTTGLLATIGLYRVSGDTSAPDPRRAEDRVAQSGPPAPTAAELLCALPDHDAVDNRTAALVPEFLLKSGVGCDSARRTPRMAQYPGDVPGLEPLFVRVRWQGAERDGADRDRAADGFRRWLGGEGGRAAFARDGFRAAGGDRALLDTDVVGDGVLRAPSPLTESAGRDAMEASLEGYKNANGPGRVLFLLDASGSMAGQWEGPSGGPGLLKQSLGGLGERDEYAVWEVADTGGDTYDTVLSFGAHTRAEAERAIDRKARVRDAEADPLGALRSALDAMEQRGAGDERPGLVVFVTDDEDVGALGGDRFGDLLALARAVDVPVAMVSLKGGACDEGKPDARVSEASGGRCVDADDDLGAALHDEVARIGTGEA
ncbi:substrate-binding domain-containing protein [Streptomyces sp. AC602_WCS936]|uniref:substrate-binding domain-containing protein n=1 Tax=Streptomyces sp. AC602_WCS936 TaxID=2823685 RepID=UPI0027E5A1B7|nr:substrate-binding domain-containing protein [Streptomyces sp. AC602_WCS936]